MGTHLIPRDVEGEGRILIIFTVQGLIGTLIGAGIGFVFYNICAMAGATIVGWILIGLFGLLGFIIGQAKVPDTNAMPLFKKVGGESIWKVIVRFVKFKQSKKIYINQILEQKEVEDTKEE
ncbi:MAG: hypothetical protein J6B87_00215 [Clostridia bacterium]|nr:hypothetical protein [Clostridia bacterium]